MAGDGVTRVLFVCHGNICRSTMAQCVFQAMVDEADVGNRFVVDSAATTNEELGMPIYPPAREELARHGVAVVPHKARRVQPGEEARWDVIVCMDEENLAGLRRILGEDAMGKVSKLMAWAGSEADVADPWYTRDFVATYRDVVAGCEGLLEQLLAE